MKNENVMIESSVALLSQHSKVHQLSVIMSGIALITLLSSVVDIHISISSVLLLLIVFCAGVIQTLFSIRIGFDSALLKNLCKNNHYNADDLNLLDQALLKLSIIKEGKAGRGLQQRLLGCKKLFIWQLSLCLLQIFVVIVLMATVQLSNIN